MLASNAGSDRVPAWWLNLQAQPTAEVLADGARHTVKARRADAAENDAFWTDFARLNPPASTSTATSPNVTCPSCSWSR